MSLGDIVLGVWITVAALGLTLAVYGVVQSWLDMQELRRSGLFNGRRVLARGRIRQEFLRILLHSLWLAIGVRVALSENRIEEINANVVILLLAALIVIIGSVLDAWDRHRLVTGRIKK